MYFDEEVVLDLRLNVLDKYVDYFVIVESNFTHRGEKRSLKFNHKKFERFKNKIIYLIYDQEPKKIEMNAGIQIIDIGIKNLKLLSNVREIDIQYKLQIKYPNPKNHP